MIKEIMTKETTKRCISIVLLLAVAILSMTIVSKIATSPESYNSTIRSIDEKKMTVMGVTATAAITSTALATVPGDATTPIAKQILELSSYLLLVVCALVLEKSLLTVMGYLSFNILVPIGCLLFGIYVFLKKKTLKILALKFIVFALVLVLIIPISMKISDMIYEANQTTIEQVTTDLSETSVESDEVEKAWIGKMIDKVKKSVSDVGEMTKEILNKFIDAIALFIITYCVLPLIIIFAIIWFINFLFKINIPTPNIKKISKKMVGSVRSYKENQLENEERELIEE